MTSQLKTAPPTDDVQELQEIAKRALKARKAASVSYGTRSTRVPQKEILARLNASQGGKNDAKGGMHRLFIPQNAMAGYAYKGYAPCLEGGKTVVFDSDIAVEIPTEIYEKELRDNYELDARQKRAFKKEAEDLAAQGGIAEEAHVPIVDSDK